MICDIPPVPFNLTSPAPAFPRPSGARNALLIGFDVDAETAWIGNTPANADDFLTVSHGGHEIGPHGYLHRRPERDALDAAREEIDRGFDALQGAFGLPRAVRRELPGTPRLSDAERHPLLVVVSRRRAALPPPACGRHGVAGRDPGQMRLRRPELRHDEPGRPAAHRRPRRDPAAVDRRVRSHPCLGRGDHPGAAPAGVGRRMRCHLLHDLLRQVTAKRDVWTATGAEITLYHEACEAAR